jgi:hypothetical protein
MKLEKIVQGIQIAQLLRNLVPNSQEELSALRRVLTFAQLLQRRTHADLELGPARPAALSVETENGTDLSSFLKAVPDDAKRYLHGLVEAMEIYQSIKGRALPVQNLTLRDQCVYELKQIRDMCLEDGLRSIY